MLSRFSLILLFACFGCSEDGQSYGPVDPPDQFGAFGVGYQTLIAIDAARDDRELPVEVWYPARPEDAQGKPRVTYPLAPLIGLESEIAVEGLPVYSGQALPLVVFSHGYGGISNQSLGLMETLASHGIVVASPTHTGNAQGSMTDTFDQAAANRVPDVSFVIDTMLTDTFPGQLDGAQVAVVGHSFGGMTAIGVAAGWAGSPPDSRVLAIVPISAVIDSTLQHEERPSPNAGFTQEQLAGIGVPVMLMGGTEDTDVLIENNRIAFEQLINTPVVYRVDIVGANHTHFTSVCTIGDLLIDMGITKDTWPNIGAEDLIGPYEASCTPEAFPIGEAIRLTNKYVVAFLKRHLLEELDYQQYLTSSAAKDEPAIDFYAR